MIHLESGECASGVSRYEIDHWSSQCYQRSNYRAGDADDPCYYCQLCVKNFNNLSAFFQHADTKTCAIKERRFFKILRNYLRAEILAYAAEESRKT